MRRSSDARIRAVVMIGSIRALIAPVLASACPAGVGFCGCAGGDASWAKLSFKAMGRGIGGGSFSGWGSGVDFGFGFLVPPPTKAASSGVSASSRDRRLTTGHLLQELLHLEGGEKR